MVKTPVWGSGALGSIHASAMDSLHDPGPDPSSLCVSGALLYNGRNSPALPHRGMRGSPLVIVGHADTAV